jgi:vitamin K-dependent gamma-carboxylase
VDRLLDWARRPVDAASLAVFRICVGVICAWEVGRYFHADWIVEFWEEPRFHFHYVGFGWVRPLPGNGMEILWGVLGMCAVLITLGALYRLAATVFAIGFGYTFLVEAATYLNHFYFLTLIAFILAVVPANRVWSIDALVMRRSRHASIPAWSLWLVRFQVAVLYIGGGIAKMDPDWLRGQPMGAWLAARTDFPLIGGWFDHPMAGVIAAWSGMFFDLFIVFAVAWRPTRYLALLAALAFHFTNSHLFSIGIFPFLALLSLLIFCEPDWPRSLLRAMQGRDHKARAFATPTALTSRHTLFAKAGLTLGMLYVATQILVPLRHLAMPGRAAWTEAGHSFSWHMKLRDKEGNVSFTVVEPRPGRRTTFAPGEGMASWQYDAMSVRPEFIRQFAHHLADQGGPGTRVYAHAMISLNGRKPQLMVDPKVDLAAEPATLGTPTWVLPLREALPSRGKLHDPAAGEPNDY